MRGSTTIKDDLLAREFIILQSSLNDRQDPMLLVSIVKNEVQRERKDIHIKRTQKSAVRQILRALKEDINSVSTTRPGMEASFVKTQQELLLQDIRQQDQLIDWAMRTQRLYEDLFVDYENTDSSSSFKPKGIVSRLAASNYGNSWMKFIKERADQILAIAPTSKPLMSNSMIESTFRTDMFGLSPTRPASSESIRVSIRNGGQGITQTWASKAEARKELPSFISLLSTLVDADNEIESVEISLAATNEISINLKGVTQSKVEQTLTKLLSQ
jgi:RNase P protein component